MITDFRINSKGESEGKVIPPTKWEEMYTKEQVMNMFTELQLEIHGLISTFAYSDGDYISGGKVEDLIRQKINALRGNEDDN